MPLVDKPEQTNTSNNSQVQQQCILCAVVLKNISMNCMVLLGVVLRDLVPELEVHVGEELHIWDGRTDHLHAEMRTDTMAS